MSDTRQSTSHVSGQMVLSDDDAITFSNIRKTLTENSKQTDATTKLRSENAKQISEIEKIVKENAKLISENANMVKKNAKLISENVTSINFKKQYTSFHTRDIKIHLDELLGIGSSSKVYKIKWNQSPAVIKVISDTEDIETLNQEVKMLRLLEKYNIRNVTKLIDNDLQNIIITPVCEPFNNNFRAKHCKELLNLLQDIHGNNIYHRDVRPENIMLNEENDSVVLVDWGSAVQYTLYNKKIPYLGTTSYASPEILANNMRDYKPQPSDDLHSFVLAMYVLRNPLKKPTNMRSCDEILTYWDNELNDRHLWKEMLDAANNNQIDELKKLYDIFI